MGPKVHQHGTKCVNSMDLSIGIASSQYQLGNSIERKTRDFLVLDSQPPIVFNGMFVI